MGLIDEIPISVTIPKLIKDEVIRKGQFNILSLGGVEMYTGGFSIVFPVEINGEKWAFKCWHTPVGDVRDRLMKLSDELKRAPLPYFCNFEYVDEGLVVGGVPQPTTRMKWIDGDNLVGYICKNRKKETLRKLAESFKAMCIDLHNNHIAHGDLQHGNILVDDAGRLFLIDYDSVYMPEMGKQADIIAGKQEYQHPNRKDNKSASEKLDYFSELIIYISILAVAEDLSLIDKYKMAADEDCMLFRKEDFSDLCHSQVYKDIAALGGEFVKLLDILKGYLKHNDINSLRPFMNIRFEKEVTFTCSASKLARGKQQDVLLSWSAPKGANVCLQSCGTDNGIINCKKQGSKRISIEDDISYKLQVKSKDGIEIEKILSIKVYDDSIIDFVADKYFSYPSIPVRLSWNVSHAQKVFLNSEEVSSSGTKITEPNNTTEYTIRAENKLGINTKSITIEMLPIPQIKALLVPAPNIEKSISIRIQQPQFCIDTKLPIINIGMINTTIPLAPSLTDIGLNVALSPPLRHFSLKRIIKRVYKKIKRYKK